VSQIDEAIVVDIVDIEEVDIMEWSRINAARLPPHACLYVTPVLEISLSFLLRACQVGRSTRLTESSKYPTYRYLHRPPRAHPSRSGGILLPGPPAHRAAPTRRGLLRHERCRSSAVSGWSAAPRPASIIATIALQVVPCRDGSRPVRVAGADGM
jgi:hypothetical protein